MKKQMKDSRLYKVLPVKYKIIISLAFLLFIIFLFLIVFVFIVVFGNRMGENVRGTHGEEMESNEGATYSASGVADEVMRYEDYFDKYTKEFGVEEHKEVIMALTMQESGGRYLDVMQSSESLGLPVNTITDPEESIEQGVKYFAQTLDEAGGDIELALQAYNMGNGFINYVDEHNNGEYSKEMAIQFSNEMASNMGWSRYGDVNYVENVMRYLEGDESVSNGKWAMPLKGEIIVTSEFGPRIHPITGEVGKMHGGIDFACTPADDILVVLDGEVVEAIHSNVGYGNYVTVKHVSNELSRYGHMSSLNVKLGDKVSQGDSLGKCGSTGGSTGNHLHLEHMTELGQAHEDKENPRKALGMEE